MELLIYGKTVFVLKWTWCLSWNQFCMTTWWQYFTHFGLVTPYDIGVFGQYCLMAPSHYLNQCWLTINMILWHSFQGDVNLNTQNINVVFEIHRFEITATSPGDELAMLAFKYMSTWQWATCKETWHDQTCKNPVARSLEWCEVDTSAGASTRWLHVKIHL